MVVLARYGLGAALYGNGQFLVGDDAFTCELGHMRIDREGARCICGRRGCLDTVVSGRTLPPADRRRGAAWERELARRMQALGVGMGNVLKIFHPPLVVLDGLYNEYEETVLPMLRGALKRELEGLGLSVPRLVIGDKAEFKTAIGAALRAADVFLADYLLTRVFNRAGTQ
jgi:predicted NBD/HSP70 family sugar kinase